MKNNLTSFYKCCLFALLLPCLARAQHQSILFAKELPTLNTTPSFPHLSGSVQTETLQPFIYQPSIPREAIFCRMESTVYAHYNFMFKIHAGEGDALPWTLKR